MSTSPLKQQKLFDLFELDPTGTVLYSRVEPDVDADAAVPSVAGHDFFNEVVPFTNAEELRRRISASPTATRKPTTFISPVSVMAAHCP